ncbi:hypothetical protein NP493_993g00016 [Ridgeia piscesae]|uniref:Calpain catalytic domain-containing protein n=1 Tax=Ridgeia piscesae TaxID=27915 RepID=A0AAD9KIP6_RIDPI|nr:hypothetical protein NP493_993g00016 [Ridgeia piscesae]
MADLSYGGLKEDAVQFAQRALDLARGKYLLSQAFEEDENENFEEAVKLYSDAVEFFLTQREQAKKASDTDHHKKLSQLAEQALDRAEAIKKKTSPPAPSPTRLPPGGNDEARPQVRRPLGSLLKDDPSDQGARQRAAPPGGSTGGGGYTKEEIQVLSDKDGKLALSAKQRSNFVRWKRPDEITGTPQMIIIVIIYPQNKKGEPQYNPCGKYMVKLHINGVPRKVIIDDFLPVGSRGELLCSYSSNASEIWVSLLEKAYLKVMGGYDFPGSNSNIDLHVLTGWIPERIAIRPNSSTFDADHEFDKILDRFHKGHCLVTMATGDISEAEADRAGLVPTHAYAMLDIRKVKGYRLFMLKNPWSHLRWKGSFSENDTLHWTEEMKRLLNYNPSDAAMFDNGPRKDSYNIGDNPQYRLEVHAPGPSAVWILLTRHITDKGPSAVWILLTRHITDKVSDTPSRGKMSHPQGPSAVWILLTRHITDKGPSAVLPFPRRGSFKEGQEGHLQPAGTTRNTDREVHAPGPSAVWILLTRHITDKDDFADNREFITLLVYKSNGKRIYYPYDPPPYKDGVRINSPHYLCKMVEEKGTSLYNLVISQYEKTRQWKGATAGGCGNFPTHGNNPIYQVKIDNNRSDNHILYSVGFDVITVPGFCVLDLENVSGGTYNIQPSTFNPGQEGPFFLNVSCSCPLTLSQLQ